MNRSMLIPAICCPLAFASLYAMLSRTAGLEDDPTGSFADTSSASTPPDTSPLPANEAERVLGSLCDAYLQQWRTWQNSPHRMLSRVALRTISPSCAEFALSPESAGPSDSFLLAMISIHHHEQTQAIPCVVDRNTLRVRLFCEGNWLTADDWLKTIPGGPK